MRRGVWTSPVALAAVLLSVAPLAAQELPRTGAERAGWTRTTRHGELVRFLDEVRAASERVLVRTIGRSAEGRSIPAVFLGDPPPATPEDAASGGKPTLLVLGSLHGDEASGREGALQFIRAVTLGDESDILDRIDVIVVPNANPDGSVAGTRLNADGYDLNRDWVVAETPEVRAILEEVVTPFRPDVFLDVHNGGAFPYHLTYQATLDPAADPDLVELARGPVFEHVKDRLEAHGMSMFWYSGPSFDDDEDRWYWRTTDPWPRKQHSYGGLQDMLTLLFEVPELHSLEEGAEVARESILALARFMADEPERIRTTVARARARTLEEPLDEVHLELEATSYPGEEEFLVMPSNPDDPTGSSVRPSQARLVEGQNRTRYAPARSRPTPWGYALDPELDEVVELLRRHGIEVEELGSATEVEVERFRVVELHHSTERYQNHRLRDVEVALEPGTVTLPQGSLLVRIRQPAGRLIPQLLEPDAVDSLLRWNLFDPHLPPDSDPVEHLPVLRLPAPPATTVTADD